MDVAAVGIQACIGVCRGGEICYTPAFCRGHLPAKLTQPPMQRPSPLHEVRHGWRNRKRVGYLFVL
jgi:hypothetical protein